MNLSFVRHIIVNIYTPQLFNRGVSARIYARFVNIRYYYGRNQDDTRKSIGQEILTAGEKKPSENVCNFSLYTFSLRSIAFLITAAGLRLCFRNQIDFVAQLIVISQ